MEFDPLTAIGIVSLFLSVVAIAIAVFTYTVENRSVKIQHIMPSLDKVNRILQDIDSHSLHVQLLKETIPRLREKIEQKSLAALPFVEMFALASTFGIQSVFMLNQNCDEFLRTLKELKDTGSFERIRRMDNSLAWRLLHLEDACLAFLKLDIVPLSKTENLLNADTTMHILENIHENATKLRELSNSCLRRLDKLLP
jgi:hypothetical protein